MCLKRSLLDYGISSILILEIMSRRRMMMTKNKDANTLLLLHAEDFTDSSMYARPITNNGVTFTTGKFNNSFYFNGNNYLSFAQLISGSSNFTIDFFVKVNSTSSTEQIFARFGGTAYVNYPSASIGIINGNILYESYDSNGMGFGNYGSITLSTGVWHHVAFIKNGSSYYGFVDGILDLSNSGQTDLGTQNTNSYIGWTETKSGESHFPLIGYIDEFRVSNIARWTANFTPPTAPYTI